MVHLDNEMLRNLQLIELELLLELDRICRKYGIKYTIIGGTLIGAVRNGGFIPWDDDADIAMLRPEYEKFRKACEEELDESKYYFQDHRNTTGYRWGYGKLRRRDTLFLREYQEHMPYQQGVFIDIFPHDGVPDNYLARCIHNLHCTLIRKTLWSAVGRISDKKMFMKGIFHLLNSIPEEKVKKYYEKFIAKSNRKDSGMVRALMFPTLNHKKYGYKKSWFLDNTELEFEGYRFMAMAGYKEYLEDAYGDYMVLPPVNQRKVHPVSDIKLIQVEF